MQIVGARIPISRSKPSMASSRTFSLCNYHNRRNSGSNNQLSWSWQVSSHASSLQRTLSRCHTTQIKVAMRWWTLQLSNAWLGGFAEGTSGALLIEVVIWFRLILSHKNKKFKFWLIFTQKTGGTIHPVNMVKKKSGEIHPKNGWCPSPAQIGWISPVYSSPGRHPSTGWSVKVTPQPGDFHPLWGPQW